MEGLNKIFCGADVKNTGICECYFDPKLITGAMFVPKNKVFTSAELADALIQTTLETAVRAVKSSRIFPFQPFEQVTDGTEAAVKQTFGYGGSVNIREGKVVWLFQFINGGLNLSNALRTFNHLIGKYNVIFIESQNTLIGTSRKDVTGAWGLAGVPMIDIYTKPWGISDGANVSNYGIEFIFDPVYVNEKIAFKRVSIDSYLLSELMGLEDIKLIDLAGDEGNAAHTVGAETDCGSTDVYDLYADELAQAIAWIVKDAAGATKAIASVTKDPALKGWIIALTGPAVFADGDTIQLAAPSILSVPPISVSGYEADTLTLDFGS